MFFKYKHIHPRSFFFFFNDTATTEIYTLSLHDALPISIVRGAAAQVAVQRPPDLACRRGRIALRSEEHTSELQSRLHLVCRLLLEKKKIKPTPIRISLVSLLPVLDRTYLPHNSYRRLPY